MAAESKQYRVKATKLAKFAASLDEDAKLREDELQDKSLGTPLSGYKVEVAQHLAGCKRGVLSGDTLYVSPAMASLMKSESADPQSFRRLLNAIEVIRIPKFDPFEAIASECYKTSASADDYR